MKKNKVIFVGIILIIISYGYYFLNLKFGFTIKCPFHAITGLHCPGCGVTRATLLLLKGHVADSLNMNPNCLFAIIFLCTYPILLLLSVIRRKPYLMNSYQMMDKMLKNKTCLYTLLAGELIIWLHNIIVGI